MKFKILTVRSPEHVQQEIDYFKLICDESRIKDICIAGGGEGFIIIIIMNED